MITDSELKSYKEKLITEKDFLEKQLSSFASRDKENPVNFHTKKEQLGYSLEDDSAEEEMFIRNIALERALERRLKEVVEALNKIQKGTFGLCERCHKQIEKQKLDINTASDFCIACSRIVARQKKK